MIGSNAVRIWLAIALVTCAVPAFAAGGTAGVAAAKKTATTSSACTSIAPFYWEIGDAKGAITSGSVGLFAPNAKSPMPIYSASKWIYAAYLVAARAGQPLTGDDVSALTMTSGYTAQGQCQLQATVSACQQTIATQDTNAMGAFFYGPGHFQKSATNLGLGALSTSDLGVEVSRKLGISIGYQNPSLAAGGFTTASEYAIFLRKLIAGTLMPGLLGVNRVCTYTGLTDGVRNNCLSSRSSPTSDPAYGLGEAWDYSLGHWVENDPLNKADPMSDIDAYSSPGAAGFYPWIDGTKSTYGIVARTVIGDTSSAKSVQCGRKIRKAWMTGLAQ